MSRAPKAALRRKVKPAKTLAERVTQALRRFGPASTDRLARRLGAKGGSVSSTCSRLVRAGVLKRTDKTAHGRGGEAVWSVKR